LTDYYELLESLDAPDELVDDAAGLLERSATALLEPSAAAFPAPSVAGFVLSAEPAVSFLSPVDAAVSVEPLSLGGAPRLSVLYHPDPLKMSPAGDINFLTIPWHSGQIVPCTSCMP